MSVKIKIHVLFCGGIYLKEGFERVDQNGENCENEGVCGGFLRFVRFSLFFKGRRVV